MTISVNPDVYVQEAWVEGDGLRVRVLYEFKSDISFQDQIDAQNFHIRVCDILENNNLKLFDEIVGSTVKKRRTYETEGGGPDGFILDAVQVQYKVRYKLPMPKVVVWILNKLNVGSGT